MEIKVGDKVWIRQNKLLFGKVLVLLLVFLMIMSGLGLSGCVGRTGDPMGWSGGVVADGQLFVGTIGGELVAIDVSDGSLLWKVTLDSPAQSGGGLFGCTPEMAAAAIYGTPVVGDFLYAGSYLSSNDGGEGIFYAFEPGREEARWIYPRQGTVDGAFIGGPVLSQGKVYVGCSDGKVYALDAAEGYKEWEFPTGDEIWSTPAIDGDMLFVSSLDKKLYAINTADGSEEWVFIAGGALVSNPIVDDGTVYVGSLDRQLYAVNADDGSLKWQSSVDAGKWFWSQPVVYQGTMYAGNLDGKIYVLDAETGEAKVEAIDMGSPISSSPVLVGDLILIASEEGKVYSLDTSNNQKKLLGDIEGLADVDLSIYAPLSVSKGTIFICAQTEKHGTVVYAMNAQSGAIEWHYPQIS
ncbi:PQQ-binding-like beta-propeller repeat protein [Chloroflexota bacterium]